MKEPDRKSKDQILDELYILNNLFRLGKEEEQQFVPYKDVLDVVALKEDADYNDLWEQIMAELSLEKGKSLISKRAREDKERITD